MIINLLSEMSRDGWRHAAPVDYEPLEAELRQVVASLDGRIK